MPLSLRSAEPADADAVIETLSQAFLTDPVSRWVIPDHTVLLDVNRRVFRLYVDLALEAGEIRVSEALAAAAIWFEVPADAPEPEEAGAGAADEPGDDFTAEVAVACAPFGDRLRVLDRVARGIHPGHERHQYLPFVGVAPRAQGTGLGTALVKDRMDTVGGPLYLEASAPRNHALYARLGFADLGPPVSLPDGPRLWPMWWDGKP